MDEPTGLRVNVTWGSDETRNARLRSVLAAFGLEVVDHDGAATLYAEASRKPPRPATGRRILVKG